MASIDVNAIPNDDFTVTDGRYPLVCLEAQMITSAKGDYKMLQLTWEHLGNPKFKIKKDNYIYGTATKDFDFDNVAVRIGSQKWKALNAVTANVANLDPAIFVKLIVGKKIEANVVTRDNNGYKNLEINKKDFFKYEEPVNNIPTNNQTTFNINVEEDPFKDM